DHLHAVRAVVAAELRAVADAVQLVDEQDGWRILLRFLEGAPHRSKEVAEVAMRLPLGQRSGDEMGATAAGQRRRERRLARAGRAAEEYAPVHLGPRDPASAPVVEVSREVSPP